MASKKITKRTRLTGVELEFVSLVPRGDDPEARLMIFKADPTLSADVKRKASKSVSDLLRSRTLSTSTKNKE